MTKTNATDHPVHLYNMFIDGTASDHSCNLRAMKTVYWPNNKRDYKHSHTYGTYEGGLSAGIVAVKMTDRADVAHETVVDNISATNIVGGRDGDGPGWGP